MFLEFFLLHFIPTQNSPSVSDSSTFDCGGAKIRGTAREFKTMNDGIFEPALDSAEPLAAQVKKILLLRILTNTLRPGERLSENELSASLGVSRQPVRDALIRLAEAGLVRALPQRGTEVTRIAIHSVYSGRFLREAVEVAVIREAAVRAEPHIIEAMDRIIEAQEVAVAKKDNLSFLALDDNLHRTFAASIGHAEVWRTLQNTKLHMDRVRYLSLPDATPEELLIEQHHAIVQALKEHHPDRAEVAVRQHLAEVLLSLPLLIRNFPDYFEGSPGPVVIHSQQPG
jgi:GntR family transcriptional regulator, rspAB operon transcriptional repressor